MAWYTRGKAGIYVTRTHSQDGRAVTVTVKVAHTWADLTHQGWGETPGEIAVNWHRDKGERLWAVS